jgi:ribonuclease VapC
VVVDTSALLAIFFNERFGPWALDQIQAHADDLMMSTVNYAEVLILAQDRQAKSTLEIRQSVEGSSIRLIAPTARHAELAADARLRYPLNLGDCFAYALAREQECGLLTLDRDFRRTDIPVTLPPKAPR